MNVREYLKDWCIRCGIPTEPSQHEIREDQICRHLGSIVSHLASISFQLRQLNEQLRVKNES
jgi:hypothetical protein